MARNRSQNLRMVVAVGIIVGIALIGLVTVNVDRASADRSETRIGATDNQTAASEVSPAVGMDSTAALGSIVRMVSALVIVIACIYVGIFLLKKLMGRRYTGRGRTSFLEVLETAHVGPRKTISLVRVADRSVLIGVTDDRIAMLTEIDAEKTAEIIATEMQPEATESFTRVLKSAANRMKEFNLKRHNTVLDN